MQTEQEVKNGDKRFGSLTEILEANDVQYKDVFVPAWGFYVRLRSLTASQRDAWEASLRRDKGDGSTERNLDNVRARLLAKMIIDPQTGERMLNKSEQVVLLGRKNAAAVTTLFDEACVLCGITKRDMEQIKKELKSESEEDEAVSDSLRAEEEL